MFILKKLKIELNNATSGYLSEEIQNTNLKKYVYPYIHCSII